MWTESHARTATAVFDALNAEGVDWLVVGDYAGLPDSNSAKDIDLIIPRSQIRRSIRTIVGAVRSCGYHFYDHRRFECIWCFTFFARDGSRVLSIKIDILYGFVWRGATVLGAKKLLAGSIMHNGFRVPGHTTGAFLLLVKPLMTGGLIKGKYRAKIVAAIENDPQGFEGLLVDTFGKALAAVIWPLLCGGGLERIMPFRRRLCTAAWFRALERRPFQTIFSTLSHFWYEVRRRANCPGGAVFSVAGPDGVGKTTFIGQLQRELGRILVKDPEAIVVRHFRPGLLPNIKRLLSRRGYDASQEEFSKPHRAVPDGFGGSLLRLVYYWADYQLGYWLVVRRRCIRGEVFVFDRYFYDFIVDPGRSRIGLPGWLRKAFLRITPQPDVVFVLDCDADTVYGRKQELGRDEIERQLGEYRKLAAVHRRRFVILDARRAPEDLSRQAATELVERSFSAI